LSSSFIELVFDDDDDDDDDDDVTDAVVDIIGGSNEMLVVSPEPLFGWKSTARYCDVEGVKPLNSASYCCCGRFTKSFTFGTVNVVLKNTYK
jgi:hypothetical protein